MNESGRRRGPLGPGGRPVAGACKASEKKGVFYLCVAPLSN